MSPLHLEEDATASFSMTAFSFVAALGRNDQNLILSGPDATLESHLMVFAAEQARREGRVVDVVI